MIVNCPSCTTLYRFESDGALAVKAHCSRCDAQFDLEPMKRAYAIVAETDAALNRALVGIDQGRGEAEHWNPPDGMNLGTFDYEPGEEAAEAVAEAVPAAARKSGVGEWLTGLFLGAVGGGSGYYLAMLQEADLATFVAGGSAIGLALGWAVIRWMAREP